MKVLAISSSPRKRSNSDMLADHALEGAKASGASVEKVRLRGLTIHPCEACDACQAERDTPCVTDDDMAPLLDKVREADAIILASPIYFFTLNGQMKVFLDRLYALFGGNIYDVLTGKKVALLLSYGDPDPLGSGANNALRTLQDACRFLGIEFAGCVHASCMSEGELEGKPALAQAKELGKKLATSA